MVICDICRRASSDSNPAGFSSPEKSTEVPVRPTVTYKHIYTNVLQELKKIRFLFQGPLFK
jgi:hypothetical protein